MITNTNFGQWQKAPYEARECAGCFRDIWHGDPVRTNGDQWVCQQCGGNYPLPA